MWVIYASSCICNSFSMSTVDVQRLMFSNFLWGYTIPRLSICNSGFLRYCRHWFSKKNPGGASTRYPTHIWPAWVSQMLPEVILWYTIFKNFLEEHAPGPWDATRGHIWSAWVSLRCYQRWSYGLWFSQISWRNMPQTPVISDPLGSLRCYQRWSYGLRFSKNSGGVWPRSSSYLTYSAPSDAIRGDLIVSDFQTFPGGTWLQTPVISTLLGPSDATRGDLMVSDFQKFLEEYAPGPRSPRCYQKWSYGHRFSKHLWRSMPQIPLISDPLGSPRCYQKWSYGFWFSTISWSMPQTPSYLTGLGRSDLKMLPGDHRWSYVLANFQNFIRQSMVRFNACSNPSQKILATGLARALFSEYWFPLQ